MKDVHYGLIHQRFDSAVMDSNSDLIPFIKPGKEPKKCTLVKEGDLILADASEDVAECGEPVEFSGNADYPMVSGLHTIHCRDKMGKTVAGFKSFLFGSLPVKQQIARLCEGTKIYSISNDTLCELWLSIPEKEEQAKIVSLLENLDERIHVQRKTIKELESFKAALSSKFISEADEKESIASLIESGLLREVKPSELKPFSGNRIYLSTSCIDGKSIISTEGSISYSFRPSRACMSPIKDSVWFAKMKNSVKVFRAQEGDSDRYVLSSGFTGLLSTTPLIDPNWLEMIFLSSEFNKQKNQMSEGGTMSGVKSGSFDELYIPYYSSTTSEQSCLVAWDKAKAIVDVESRKLVGLMKLREYCLTNLFA